MNEPPKPPSHSDLFRAMAERLDHNTGSTFGGAFVIIPPPGGGERLEALILDASADPAQFFMLLQAKIQTILEELRDRARTNSAFGR